MIGVPLLISLILACALQAGGQQLDGVWLAE